MEIKRQHLIDTAKVSGYLVCVSTLADLVLPNNWADPLKAGQVVRVVGDISTYERNGKSDVSSGEYLPARIVTEFLDANERKVRVPEEAEGLQPGDLLLIEKIFNEDEAAKAFKASGHELSDRITKHKLVGSACEACRLLAKVCEDIERSAYQYPDKYYRIEKSGLGTKLNAFVGLSVIADELPDTHQTLKESLERILEIEASLECAASDKRPILGRIFSSEVRTNELKRKEEVQELRNQLREEARLVHRILKEMVGKWDKDGTLCPVQR